MSAHEHTHNQGHGSTANFEWYLTNVIIAATKTMFGWERVREKGKKGIKLLFICLVGEKNFKGKKVEES